MAAARPAPGTGRTGPACSPSPQEILARLAELLLQSHTGDLVAVGVADLHGPTLAVHLAPLDSVEQLLGFTAPAQWDAAGVVSGGQAWSLGDEAHLPGQWRGDVAVAHLVDRSGASVTCIRGLGPQLETGHTVGRVPELCARSLGLATPPPSSPPLALLQVLWLDRICAELLERELGAPPPRWEELVWWHPAAGQTPQDPPTPQELATVVRHHAATTTWSALRQLCARGELAVPGLAAPDAGWMDDGMFCRWSLGLLPPAHELLADLGVLLPSELAEAVRTVVGA